MAKKKVPSKNKTPRTRKAPEYKSFRLSKKIKPAGKPIPGILKLYKAALLPFKSNKRLFLGIIFIHFAFMIVFVSGLASSADFVTAKNNFQQTFGGSVSNTASILTLFSYALSSGNGGGVTADYQIFITLLVSLALVWSVRQVMAGEKIGVRQAFYQGMYPLVPFLAVLAVIGLQLIPLVAGNLAISTVFGNSLAVTVMEQILWWMLYISLALLSIYMVLSSVFALFISTLPDMTPLRALRSARSLVLNRRLQVSVRLLGLPVIMIVFYGIVLIPLIFILPIAVVPAFLLLNSFNLFFIISYIYNLYRELI